jgi:hypothetical protein
MVAYTCRNSLARYKEKDDRHVPSGDHHSTNGDIVRVEETRYGKEHCLEQISKKPNGIQEDNFINSVGAITGCNRIIDSATGENQI